MPKKKKDRGERCISRKRDERKTVQPLGFGTVQAVVGSPWTFRRASIKQHIKLSEGRKKSGREVGKTDGVPKKNRGRFF